MKIKPDIAPPSDPTYSPPTMSDEDFWGKPPEGPETWTEDAALLADPKMNPPEPAKQIHIHIH